MRALMRSLAPSCFEDIAALVALYRPGPMSVNMHNDYADRKNGRKPVQYFHPLAEELLADTYGLMIYQESVMRVSQRFAGYSLAEADNLRKACGKAVAISLRFGVRAPAFGLDQRDGRPFVGGEIVIEKIFCVRFHRYLNRSIRRRRGSW